MKNYDNCKFEATRAIAQAMEAESIAFSIRQETDYEVVCVKSAVDEGPTVEMKFFSSGDSADFDVSIRCLLINDITAAKRDRMKLLCNELNSKNRHIKFFVNAKYGDLYAAYDLLSCSDAKHVGKACVELMRRLALMLDRIWPSIMEALWTDKPLSAEKNDNGIASRLRDMLEEHGIETNGGESMLDLLQMLKAARNAASAAAEAEAEAEACFDNDDEEEDDE